LDSLLAAVPAGPAVPGMPPSRPVLVAMLLVGVGCGSLQFCRQDHTHKRPARWICVGQRGCL
jgi:hypothetical protein